MGAFRVLGDCYLFPDPGLSEKLKKLEIYMEDICQPAVGCINKIRNEFEAMASIEALKIDFSKLFIGPFKLFAAPYGSIYLEDGRQVMGKSTLDVRVRYLEAGLDLAKDFKDAPDHISAELEFMHYLIFKEIEALSKSEPKKAADYIHKQRSFLEDHLLAWVPTFAGNVIKYAETRFYQYLAKATEIFLEISYQRVKKLSGFQYESILTYGDPSRTSAGIADSSLE